MKPFRQILRVKGHRHEAEPVGVIDIGSNSVRLVVYKAAARFLTPLFNEKVLCGLGRAMASTGRLDPDAVECAVQALTRFRTIAGILKVNHLKAIATAAVRDAANGREFVERAEKACGTPIRILSGDVEAELAAQGVMMGFQDPDGVAGDLGGGSLELVNLSAGRVSHATTLGLGGLRLMDVAGSKLDKATAIVDAELALAPWIGLAKGRPFYAIGGTWRALARLHMAETNYPLRVIDAYAIPAQDAAAFCEAIRKGKKNGAPKLDGIAKARRETLPYGALVMERFLSAAEPSEVVFSASGIREGLIYSLLPQDEREKDPLLEFCEDWARRRARSYEHACELRAWTDQLFRSAEMAETAGERRLRHAACFLSDIAWQTHPDYRGEQSFSMIAHAALSGTDHAGRIFLALAVYYRNAGPGERGSDALADALAERLNKPSVKRARLTGAAIRVGHMLSVGRPGVIPHAPLRSDGDIVALTLPSRFAPLDGERLRSRLATLASLLDRTPEIRFSA